MTNIKERILYAKEQYDSIEKIRVLAVHISNELACISHICYDIDFVDTIIVSEDLEGRIDAIKGEIQEDIRALIKSDPAIKPNTTEEFELAMSEDPS